MWSFQPTCFSQCFSDLPALLCVPTKPDELPDAVTSCPHASLAAATAHENLRHMLSCLILPVPTLHKRSAVTLPEYHRIQK